MELKNIDSSSTININQLSRGYGKTKVLSDLNLSIKQGTINCIVGPSGCGKIILGRLVQDSGKVEVFGKPVHSGLVPGSVVGYSPQEVALYEDLSIGETVKFHARLHCMSNETFEARKNWLMNFLDIPKETRVVGTLSGGQKRRVSLMVSLLHDPKLLILDEPTVGVDPSLRLKILNHLKEIAKSGVTIIVTTHYIEETKFTDKVFFMRYGRILEEGNPNSLARKYQCETLEDVFLLLCKSDDHKYSQAILKGENPSIVDDGLIELSPRIVKSENTEDNIQIVETPGGETTDFEFTTNGGGFLFYIYVALYHTFAITLRQFTQVLRNKIVLMFEILSPTLQIFLFFIAIGSMPKNLKFGVVNDDVGIGPPINISLSNEFLLNLRSNGVFELVNFTNIEDSIKQIELTHMWGSIYIPENFTTAMAQRMSDPSDQWAINQSNIDLYLDQTNYQISILVERSLRLGFEKLGEKYNLSLNPVKLMEPIYGDDSTTFISFLAPGMMALVTFSHAIGMTSVSFVREKIDGSLDRVFAVGVGSKSIIFGHFFAHVGLILIQTLFIMILSVFGFGEPVNGQIVLVVILIVVLGFVGMNLGLVISSIASVEIEAMQLSIATLFPLLLLSGVIWPAESIPHWFKWAHICLPTSWASYALRDIMIRGNNFTDTIWKAFLI
eukprot:gene9392-11537_t